MRSLPFHSVIWDTDGSPVIAMDLCFGLWMAQFFKGHSKNHALFAIEEEGTKFGFGGRCSNKSKYGT
jgi:hypothetical protein